MSVEFVWLPALGPNGMESVGQSMPSAWCVVCGGRRLVALVVAEAGVGHVLTLSMVML